MDDVEQLARDAIKVYAKTGDPLTLDAAVQVLIALGAGKRAEIAEEMLRKQVDAYTTLFVETLRD